MSHFIGTPTKDIYYVAVTIAVICSILLVAAPASAAPTNTGSIDADTPTNTSTIFESDFPSLTADYVTHHFVILTDQVTSDDSKYRQTVQTLEHTAGVTVVKEDRQTNTVAVAVNTRDQSRQALRIQGVEKINSNAIYVPRDWRQPNPDNDNSNTISAQGHVTPPTYQEYTHGLKRLDVPEAWNTFNTKGENVKIAVLDSGVDVSHPDIELAGSPQNNYKGAWADIVADLSKSDHLVEGENAPTPYDSFESGHGTHVAGTATGGDSTGVHIGVAPNAGLMAVNFFRYNGTYVTPDYIAESIYWAVNNGADVISISGGVPMRDYYPAIPYRTKAVRYAQNQGVPVIVASGNIGQNYTSGLAAQQESISIGATTTSNEVASFSNGKSFDPAIHFSGQINNPSDIPESRHLEQWTTPAWENPRIVPYVVAPGTKTWSAKAGTNTLSQKTGTSMSTPHISGIAALAMSNNPSLTVQEFRKVLKVSASPVSGQPNTRNTRQGYGQPNAVEVLKLSDKGGYITPQSISVNESVEPGEPIHISTTVANENIIGDADQTDISLYINGTVKETIASDVVIESESEQTFSTTYNTTATSKDKQISIKTADTEQSTVATVKPVTTPTAAYNFTPRAPAAGEKIIFNGTESSTTDSNITAYEWKFEGNDTSDVSGERVTYTFSKAGKYDVTLTVANGEGATADITQTINVTGADTGMVDAPGGVKLPSEYTTGADNSVRPSGIGKAAADFRSGDIGTKILGNAAIAFRES